MLPDYTPVEGDYPPGNPNMPFGYLGGLIGWIASARSQWRVFSYKDINIKPDHNDSDYLSEFRRWHKLHLLDRHKHVLFQYDVDARPDATEALIRVHLEAGVPANVMIFHERIWDRVFKNTGKIEVDESYKLDFGLLREFSQAGGVVGYHCNVWERSLFDINKARDIFSRDIEALRSSIEIDFFSMHGGPLDKQGHSNAHIDLRDLATDLGLTWVHNGRSPSFHRVWDDGGAGHPNYRYRLADAGELLGIVNKGNRCRLLFHPQYYRCTSAQHVKNNNQEGMRWFEDMLEQYKTRTSHSGFQKPKLLRRIFKQKQVSLQTDCDWFSHKYWPAKLEQAGMTDAVIRSCVADVQKNESPIFINGMSRSGTTLMNALLDVRPDIAMSYELYPNYLTGHGDVIEKPIEFMALAYLLRNLDSNGSYKVLQEAGYDDFIRFIACAGHSDLTPNDIGNLLYEYLKVYNTIHTYEDSLKFVGVCARLKMKRLGKSYWGAKSQGKFEKYTTIWPNARFIYMMRDIRDIFASQLNNGSFNPDPEKLAKAWVSRIKRFTNLMKSNTFNGVVVKYEELVTNTETSLCDLCNALDIPFHTNMLKHTDHDISLLHEPRGQLSAARIAKPIDSSSIGRWKTDLDSEQTEIFQSIAGRELGDWGYELS